MFLIFFLILAFALNKISWQRLSVVNVQSKWIQFWVVSHGKWVKVSRVDPQDFWNSEVIWQLKRVCKEFGVDNWVNVCHSDSKVLRGSKVWVLALRWTTLKLEFSDDAWNLVQEFISDFGWLVVKEFRRINSAQDLKLIKMYICNGKVINTFVHVLKFGTDEVPEINYSDSSFSTSCCVHHRELDKASIWFFNPTINFELLFLMLKKHSKRMRRVHASHTDISDLFHTIGSTKWHYVHSIAHSACVIDVVCKWFCHWFVNRVIQVFWVAKL